jgi:hypothetical protein
LFFSAHLEEISLLKILALAEVANGVNFATCSVQWARNLPPHHPPPCPQKQVRGAMDTAVGRKVSHPRMRVKTFRDLKTLSPSLHRFFYCNCVEFYSSLTFHTLH